MKPDLLEILRCPQSGSRLALQEPLFQDGEVISGWLVSEGGGERYAIRDFIPRFVPASNYSDNFGMQWNKFRQTQLDSFSGYPISAGRFWKATAWQPEQLRGQWVLDVGCGAGRFAEVALGAGANVVALDYSSAVEACYANLKHHPNLNVVQGDVYALPFLKRHFSFVYSLGVLQHTPDPGKALAALPGMLRENGRLCVDFYQKTWKSLLLPKYWLRPITKRVPSGRLFEALEAVVPALLPLSRIAGKGPLGPLLKRLIPVADPIYFYERTFGRISMSQERRLEWALLDTFDWLSPRFDNPQSAATLRRWLESSGIADVEVLKAGHLVGRGAARSKQFQEGNHVRD